MRVVAPLDHFGQLEARTGTGKGGGGPYGPKGSVSLYFFRRKCTFTLGEWMVAHEAVVRRIDDLVRGDIDPEFLYTVCRECGWAYPLLFDQILTDPQITPERRDEEFMRRRNGAIMSALARAAEKHGVPYDFRRLPCNGQRKLVMRAGRVTLIQESISKIGSPPSLSEYKVGLASTYGVLQQLELDLRDVPNRNLEFGGDVMGVILHGAAGTRFTRDGRALGSLMLAVPDADYRNWVARYDLHDLAMFGSSTASAEAEDTNKTETQQQDKVHVRVRNRSDRAEEA